MLRDASLVVNSYAHVIHRRISAMIILYLLASRIRVLIHNCEAERNVDAKAEVHIRPRTNLRMLK